MNTILNNREQPRQAGFSLVEVLIALVIMSIGMLGIAGLYVQGMQAGRTSMFRHQAVILAGDIADRIRANPTAGIAYNHLAAAAGTDNSCVSGGIACTPAQMAANDIFIWQDQADTSLPGGDIAVTFTAAVGALPPTYLINVTWTEPNPLGGIPPSFAITIPVLPI